MSYKSKDRMTGNLFADIMPFGGKLNGDNRWFKLQGMIPWIELETKYREYFSTQGRPGKDSRLITGILIIKHLMKCSDQEVVQSFLENPYLQYFCGYDQFVTTKEIESSTLTRMRKRLGVEYFRKFEEEVVRLLKDRRIIKDAELMVDATAYPANIAFPTDTGLLENTRKWLVKRINEIRLSEGINKKVRTYCRKAREVFLNFQKKRKKTAKAVQKTKKQLAQFVRRNIGQLKTLLLKAKTLPGRVVREIEEQLETAEKIYAQQREMLRTKTHAVADRIVSFHRSHIRPIVRGKSGRDVEFGPKGSVSCVDGYMFLDVISFDAYNEGTVLEESINLHQERFGRNPETVITDKIYGSRKNREMLDKKSIRASLIPLGRKCEASRETEKWVRQKQRKRNQIEGYIGVSKMRYGLERLRYKNEELNVRLGLLAMNLSTAMARI